MHAVFIQKTGTEEMDLVNEEITDFVKTLIFKPCCETRKLIARMVP